MERWRHGTCEGPVKKTLVVALLAAGLMAAAAPAVRHRADVADVVLLNGHVITVDAADHVRQAVAIGGDKILAVGTNDEIKKLIGPGTQQVDLHGLTVTPGLLDAHAHFAQGGTSRLFTLDLSYPEVKNLADVRTKLAERVAHAAPGDWVNGKGWDEGKLTERRYIHAADIDAVSPNNPVRLTHTTGHYIVVNTAAMKLSNITKDTPDPPGGTIDRYPDGTPTGVFKENATRLVRSGGGRGSGLPADATEQGIRELAKAFNEEGMTGAKDPAIGMPTWNAYKKVLADGGLTVRIFTLWLGGSQPSRAADLIAQIGSFTKPYESTGDDHLVSGGIKLYIDGSGGARTGWMYDDWNKESTGIDTGNKGYPTSSPDSIRALIKIFLYNAGLHIGVHSIGDQGIDWVVDSYAEAEKENPKPGLRHSIIHSNIPKAIPRDLGDGGSPEAVRRRVSRAVVAVHAGGIGDTYAGNLRPEARGTVEDPFKTFMAKGVMWANGSDYDVTPYPARYAIWAAVAREPLLGVYGAHPFGTAESVDVHYRAEGRDDLGGASDVSREEDRLDRGWEVRGSGGVGPRSSTACRRRH